MPELKKGTISEVLENRDVHPSQQFLLYDKFSEVRAGPLAHTYRAQPSQVP